MHGPDPISFRGTDRFEIGRRIGAGAMGVVYEAFDRERGMRVALKVMRSAAPESLRQFKHELRALAGISHPNLVALHELHLAGADWFLTMELLEGEPLARYVREGGVLDVARLRACVAQLAAGVAALHAAGRMHRDIKPSNIVVGRDGRVVLLDFGIIAEIGTADRARLGTPAYAAPEQGRGEATPASDWYAVGVVLYELLTGGLPFQGTSRAIMFDKDRYDPQPVRVRDPDAPADLAELCEALLRRDPAARPTGAEVLARLDVAAPVRASRPRTAVDTDRLVGRADAVAALRAAYTNAESGRGTVVHVRGASGIGKSTLLRAFVRDLRDDGTAVVLVGRCYPQESVPYKAVDTLVDTLAQYLATLPATEADAVLPRDILLLAQVFPVLQGIEAVARARRRRGPLPDPHELKRRAFAALRELVARLAEVRPVVLVIDDVQWGDVDSAPILDGLMLPPDTPPILLVLAYRSEDEERAPLLRVLRERRERLGDTLDIVEISLSPLEPADARALAIELLGDAAAADAIAAESGGVPFLVHELALAPRGNAPSVELVVAHRLDELARSERVLLELIAQAAKPIARGVLAQASKLPPDQLERDLARLVSLHLVRITSTAGSDAPLECYHDRIREAVAASVSPERSRELHAQLAHALEHSASTDHEALAVHWDGAGDRARAGEHALAAAELANRAFAFDRAARLFRTALELLELDAARTREVRTALGDALANAGQGSEAAEAYLSAIPGAPAADATELRRRAASQYLRCGLIERGLQVLDDVLSEVGDALPRSTRRALMSLAWHRLRLRVRGLGFERCDPTTISPYELARVDVMWTAATSLGMVDPVMGAAFATRQALLALELGEPTRVARALVAEAMFLAIPGHRTAVRTDAVLARAQPLIEELDDDELRAWIAAARGLAAYQRGEFRDAIVHSDEAGRRMREFRATAFWETGGVEALSMWSLFYLGELRELSRRVEAARVQARLRGNRFDGANFNTGRPAIAWAVADRTAQGRIEVERAIAEWSPRGFHLQHYYALLATTSFDLYDGRAADADRRVTAAWPTLLSARLLISQTVTIEAHHLRARTAIAVGRDPSPELRVVARYTESAWANAMSALIRAGATRDRSAAAAALAAAAARCAEHGLAAFAAAARRRRGELLADAGEVAAADRALAEQGVRAPDRFARMLVPLHADSVRDGH